MISGNGSSVFSNTNAVYKNTNAVYKNTNAILKNTNYSYQSSTKKSLVATGIGLKDSLLGTKVARVAPKSERGIDILLFFFNFKAGFYERFYSYFDMQTIIRSVKTFIEERALAIAAHERELFQ